MHRLVVSCSVLAALAVAGCATDDLASTTQESHSWNGYHWARTANPFTLKVGDNVTSTWDSYLVTSVSDWSQSTVLDLREVAGSATSKRCRATAGRVEVCNAAYGNNGWLGIASISASGSHITQGTVKLNDTYFNTAQYNTPAWRNLVTCQEVGHTLGLDHQDTDFNNTPLGTCMDYSNDPTPNQHPDQHDYDELVTIYSHLDSTTTIGAATTSASGAGETPAEWGELVASSHHGQVETYVLDHGNGNRTITFVTWAE